MTTDFNQLMQFLRGCKNPQQFVFNMVQERMGNNPFFSNLLSLAQKNNGKEIETIARNMCKEKGMNFDKEITNFKRYLGL